MQLAASRESLQDRLGNESRRAHDKLLDPVRLDELLATHDPSPIHADDLSIDTDTLTPDAAAELIAKAIEMRRPATALDDSHIHEMRSVARFNELAAVQVASGCVLHDDQGRVLIVNPPYKDHWELPGGAVEPNESPLDACRREIAKELSLEMTPRRLLCVDHQSMRPPRREALRFVFDGGHLDDQALNSITLNPDELQDWKFSQPRNWTTTSVRPLLTGSARDFAAWDLPRERKAPLGLNCGGAKRRSLTPYLSLARCSARDLCGLHRARRTKSSQSRHAGAGG